MTHDRKFSILSGDNRILTVAIIVSDSYDFTSTGPGSYDFEPSNLFYFVDPATNTAEAIYASLDNVITIDLSGNLSPQAPPQKRQTTISLAGKPAKFVGCSVAHQTAINSTIVAATDYAKAALA